MNIGDIVAYRGMALGLLWDEHLQIVSFHKPDDRVGERICFTPSALCQDHSDGSQWLMPLSVIVPVANERCICDTCYESRKRSAVP